MVTTMNAPFNYGHINCTLSLDPDDFRDDHHMSVSKLEMRSIITRAERFAFRRMQDEVAPALEGLVEEQGGEIGRQTPAITMMEHPFLDTSVASQVKCDVMADVDVHEVTKTVTHSLLIPLDDYLGKLEKETRRRQEMRRHAGEAQQDYGTPIGALLNRVIKTLRNFR